MRIFTIIFLIEIAHCQKSVKRNKLDRFYIRTSVKLYFYIFIISLCSYFKEKDCTKLSRKMCTMCLYV